MRLLSAYHKKPLLARVAVFLCLQQSTGLLRRHAPKALPLLRFGRNTLPTREDR